MDMLKCIRCPNAYHSGCTAGNTVRTLHPHSRVRDRTQTLHTTTCLHVTKSHGSQVGSLHFRVVPLYSFLHPFIIVCYDAPCAVNVKQSGPAISRLQQIIVCGSSKSSIRSKRWSDSKLHQLSFQSESPSPLLQPCKDRELVFFTTLLKICCVDGQTCCVDRLFFVGTTSISWSHLSTSCQTD